jgi:hypothetical protein
MPENCNGVKRSKTSFVIYADSEEKIGFLGYGEFKD